MSQDVASYLRDLAHRLRDDPMDCYKEAAEALHASADEEDAKAQALRTNEALEKTANYRLQMIEQLSKQRDEYAQKAVDCAATTEALREALIAARQFIDPGIDRGPAVDGWQNTVDLVDAALAAGAETP